MSSRSHFARSISALAFLLSTSACASLMGGGTAQLVYLNPSAPGASFVVTSSSGLEMASGTGNETIRLPRKNEYQVVIKAPGYRDKTVAITKGLNGWVWGNLVFGWVVGFAIDFIGGAAYKLEPAVLAVRLEQTTANGGAAMAHVLLYNKKGELIKEIVTQMEPALP